MSDETKLTRREVVQAALLGTAAMAVAPVALTAQETKSGSATVAMSGSEVEELSVAELRAGLESGRFTSRDLVEKYLARIATIDKSGPALNSVLEINPDALSIADALDRERAAKKLRGPMHGIPVLIKDNIDTHDRMQTTAGSLALAGSIAPRDAFVVERLRAAGAIILGKTNLSEWANFRSTHSTSAWSARGGLSRNPYALDRQASGSSSGSAGAAAASLCAVAVGSETDGSIVSPASSCGIVGLKPTVGLVSRSGIIPISATQDTAGPMGRTVADVAALLGAMVGVDPRDQATAASSGKSQVDYAQFLKSDGLRGARIGVVRAKAFGLSGKTDPILDQSVAAMKNAGAEIVDPVEIETLGKFDDSEFEVLLYEFKDGLNRYLATRPDAKVHSLKELIAFNEAHRGEELKYFGQEILTMAEEKGPLTSKAYLEALAKDNEMSREKGIDAAVSKHKLDALVAITNGPATPIDLLNGDSWSGGSSTIAAVAGYPTITVPAGYFFGLPIGVSFFGKAWSEPTLLRLAYAFEQATKARRKPRYLPTVEL